MALCNYQLKRGVLLQAFGDASKVMTNDNITDELAEFHLKRDPSCARFFTVMPGKAYIPTNIRTPSQAGPTIIVPPVVEVPPKIKEEEPKITVNKSEIELIKEKLDKLNVKYHPKTGLEKLKILLDKSENPTL